MRPDLSTLLPQDKIETEKAEAIVALGFPTVEPILPALVEWMQDINWPVAQVLQPFLAGIINRTCAKSRAVRLFPR